MRNLRDDLFTKIFRVHVSVSGKRCVHNDFASVFELFTFHLFSGALVCYLLLKELKNNNGPRNINWVKFYFHRFWR